MKDSPRPVLTVAMFLLLSAGMFIGPSETDGFTLDTFSNGATSYTLVFTESGEFDKTVEIEIDPSASIVHAEMKIRGAPNIDGRFPRNVTVNVGDDEDLEWSFYEAGYGALGEQIEFNDGAVQRRVGFTNELYNDSVSIRIPVNATIGQASVVVEGQTGKSIVFFNAGQTPTTWESQLLAWFQSQAHEHQWEVIPAQFTTSLSAYIGSLHIICPDSGSYPAYVSAAQEIKNNTFDRDRGLAIMGGYGNKVVGALSLGRDSDHFSKDRTGCYVDGNYAGITTGYSGYNTVFSAGEPWDSYIYRYVGSNGVHLATLRPMWPYDDKSSFAVWDSNHTYNGEGPHSWTGLIGGRAIFNGMAMTENSSFHPAWDVMVGRSVDWAMGGAIFPENVTVDVGVDGGPTEVDHHGVLDGSLTLEGAKFVNAINKYMDSGPETVRDSFGNEFALVPLCVGSTAKGHVVLRDLSITYDWDATIDIKLNGSLTEEIISHIDPMATENVSIPIIVHSDSPCKVILSGLNITYNAAPWFRSGLPTTLQAFEDEPDSNILDISSWAADDMDDPETLLYEIVKNSKEGIVDVFISDGHWLGVDPSITPDWNSGMSSEDPVKVQVKITDSEERSSLSPTLHVDVLPVNDEPVPWKLMPDVNMPEGGEDTSLVLDERPYFTDVESDVLYYSIAVDPLGSVPAASGNLTASLDLNSLTATLRSQGDFFTADDEPIPVWVYCDDDRAINTIEDGFLDPEGATPNWSHQEFNVTVKNVNDPPVWGCIPDIITYEDTPLMDAVRLSEYVTDLDSPQEDWTFTVLSNSNRQLKVTIDETTSSINLTPAENAHGTAKVEVEVSDGRNDSKTEFNVIVLSVNDRPTVKVFTPLNGDTILGMVKITGYADDVEGDLSRVEYRAGDHVSWAHVSDTAIWAMELDTSELPNGPLVLTFRSFDGVLFSENLTLDLVVDNPNAPPTVTVISPTEGELVQPGTLVIRGTSFDPDDPGVVVQVQVPAQGWLTAVPDPLNSSQWSLYLDTTGLEGRMITIIVVAYDGITSSIPQNVTFMVQASVVDDDGSGDGKDGRTDDMMVVLISIILFAVLSIVLVYLYMSRRRGIDKNEREDSGSIDSSESILRALQQGQTSTPRGNATRLRSVADTSQKSRGSTLLQYTSDETSSPVKIEETSAPTSAIPSTTSPEKDEDGS